MAIKWRVDELAARKGWGPRQLADRAGVDIKTARNILTGKATRVDLDTIDRLARALEVPPGDLWKGGRGKTAADRFASVAGSAGQATKDEMAWVLGRGPDPYMDSGLERAMRGR
jgi:DNA-binding Xre family transcriptional regulator